jgi:hypothetical protein
MPKPDPNQKTLEQVRKKTESEPVDGADLLESEELRKKLKEGKQPEPSRRSVDR